MKITKQVALCALEAAGFAAFIMTWIFLWAALPS